MSQRSRFTQAWIDLSARFSRSAGGGSGNILDGMASREFEALLGEAFRLQGYLVTPAGSPGTGAGVDLVLRRERQTHLVRCSPWRASKVGVGVVQELHSAMVARGAAGGIVVTAGRFSREATAFAGGSNISLIEGPALTGLIKRAQGARAASTNAGAAVPR